MLLRCCAETTQEGDVTRPYLLKDEEGQVTSAGDEGHVCAAVRGPQHHIRLQPGPVGWGWDPTPPSGDPRLPAGLKSGGQQVKTQALDTSPLSLLLQARAAAAVSTQRVQTHPVRPQRRSGVGHTTAKAAPSASRTWAGPAQGQHGQGLPPHVDRWMWHKLLAVGMKRQSIRQELPISRRDRGHLSCAAGLVEARRMSGVPSLPQELAEAGPGQALKLGTIVPAQPGCPCRNPGEVIWRPVRLGRALGLQNQEEDQPPPAWPTRDACLPHATCGAPEALAQ